MTTGELYAATLVVFAWVVVDHRSGQLLHGVSDGLRVRPDENKPSDSYEAGGRRTVFNGDWRAQKLSEQEYQQTFAAAGSQYRRMLTALLGELARNSRAVA